LAVSSCKPWSPVSRGFPKEKETLALAILIRCTSGGGSVPPNISFKADGYAAA
jgi:hypothetical protein